MRSRSAVVAAAAIALTSALQGTAAGARHPPDGTVIKGSYVVVFDRSTRHPAADTRQLEEDLGFDADLRYGQAIEGFAATLSRSDVQRLRREDRVAFVSRDRRVEALGNVPLAAGEPTPPSGVRRILAGSETTAREQSETSVAVIDTGIQLSHPDLNAADGTNCVSPGSPASDGHGHGTHVAGTIAAKNDGGGVVGVAPNTTVYAVKVLNDSGSGTYSQVICGIDWVTANASALGIGVANMSLGGLGPALRPCSTTTDAMHKAICRSTAAGITYVVAAGNSGWDFDFQPVPDTPAAYPEVLTASAISDSDGLPGGSGGPPGCRPGELDDAAASFSNYAATAEGAAHTIAAPGVCIKSTWNGDSYNTISGTSMASPHVAGAVALCMNEAGIDGPCADATPAQVIARMRADASAYSSATPDYGFLRDPLHSPFTAADYGFLTVATPTGDSGSPPSRTSRPSISGTMRDGETLVATPGSWAGTAPLTYAYEWRRCQPRGGSCAEIAGATGSTYELTAADVGSRLRVRIRAANPFGMAGATSGATRRIAAAPPVNTAAPVITGAMVEGERLKSSTGAWAGTPPTRYSYQWLRCNRGGSSCRRMPPATRPGYRLRAADVGSRLRVVVTVRNSAGLATASSVAGGPVSAATGPGARHRNRRGGHK